MGLSLLMEHSLGTTTNRSALRCHLNKVLMLSKMCIVKRLTIQKLAVQVELLCCDAQAGGMYKWISKRRYQGQHQNCSCLTEAG